MQRTVDFYSNVLGMPLIKSLDLPDGLGGQHFFFDAGNGDCVAFFWFAEAPPDGTAGNTLPAALPGLGSIVSAVGSMNHLAFHVPEEKFDEYRRRLKEKGVRVGPVLNHDDSPQGATRELHPGVYVRSFYFNDPDGIVLEFACWTREFSDNEAGTRRRRPLTANSR